MGEGGELVDSVGKVRFQKEGTLEERDAAWNEEMNSLFKWNLTCGLLHLAQGGGLMYLSYSNDSASSFKVPITSLF
jgi:hypothetical protein